MNILEYFAFIENDFFSHFITILFTIGIYPIINLLSPIINLFISWLFVLYLYANLRYSLRLAYFIKEKRKEYVKIDNGEKLDNEDLIESDKNNNEELTETDKNDKDLIETDKNDNEENISEIKESTSWEKDFEIEN